MQKFLRRFKTQLQLNMKKYQVEKCRAITESLQSKSFGFLFQHPVDPEDAHLEGYADIVKKPMSFSTVFTNLTNNKYESPKKWLEDMTLIFTNAITYYETCDPQNPLSIISTYMLHELQKIAVGMEIDDEKEWMKAVQTTTKKLTNLFANPPSIDQTNPKITEIIKKLDSIPDPETHDLVLYIDKLNAFGKKTETKNDLYALLKEVGHILPENIKNKPLDLETMDPTVVKSLIEYAKEAS